MSDKLNSLKEAGRLLALYLPVAEYLTGQRAQNPIEAVLADCFDSASMPETGADLSAAEEALRKALAHLDQLSRDNNLKQSASISLSEAPPIDCSRLIEEATERIRLLLDAEIPAKTADGLRFARWYSELAGSLLNFTFKSEQEGGEVGKQEMLIIYLLTIATSFVDVDEEPFTRPSAESLFDSLDSLLSLLPHMEKLGMLEPNPWKIFHLVLSDTADKLEREIALICE